MLVYFISFMGVIDGKLHPGHCEFTTQYTIEDVQVLNEASLEIQQKAEMQEPPAIMSFQFLRIENTE